VKRTNPPIELIEFQTKRLPAAEIPDQLGENLWRHYKDQVAVESPSFKTDYQWQLISQGWVGYITLSPEVGIVLLPKVPLGNIFRMLEYAYRLKSFRLFPDIFETKTIEDFYEQLSSVLCKRIMDRSRKGFYRAYLQHSENLPYVCGRLDIHSMLKNTWDVNLRCTYHEHTADVEENQILGWTLSRILKSSLCTDRVLPLARQTFRTLQNCSSLVPCGTKNCVNRLYNRLNDDYLPLHALCRFFLENSGPTHEIGDHPMLPFLVDMARLYELFVAEWLAAHLPAGLKLRAQEKVDIDKMGFLHFAIDLVLYDEKTGKSLCILDTKYKSSERPSTDDVAKVSAYAGVKGCNKAFLVYPTPLTNQLDAQIGHVLVRGLTFSIDADIELAGQKFMANLLKKLSYEIKGDN
jgi:5-methylcytosine-specific restriction enzyme subunit McrC